jgi:hypothetical protein
MALISIIALDLRQNVDDVCCKNRASMNVIHI